MNAATFRGQAAIRPFHLISNRQSAARFTPSSEHAGYPRQPRSMEKYVIPNLRNACQLLKAIAQGDGHARIADLARDLEIPATSALRIVRTLEFEGFVRR